MTKTSPKEIWDWPTRVCHWVLASCVLLDLFVFEGGDPPHRWTGYLASFVVAFRFIWGFLGGKASRWTQQPIHPKQIIFFIRHGFSDPERKYEGHNPLAALVYIAIWGCVLSLGLTGWMMGLDQYWGEEWLEELHEGISLGIRVLFFIHISGVFIDSFRCKRKTWAAMFTGHK